MQIESSNSGPVTYAPASLGLTAVPLFHAAWIFASGIVLAHWIWVSPSYLLVALILFAVFCAIAALRASRVTWLPLAALWLALGAWCAEMEPYPAPAPALAALSDNLLRTVDGTVLDAGPVRAEVEPKMNDQDDADPDRAAESQPSQRIDLRVSSLEVVTDSIDAQEPIFGGVRLTVRWPTDQRDSVTPFHCGDRIRAVARLLPPVTYHDPGVWSREDYLVEQGITSTASVTIERVERIGRDTDQFWLCRIHGMQHLAGTRLLALPSGMRRLPTFLRLTQDDAVMLSAMVTGDRTYLTHSLRVGFERTGSFHMLVVSGFHLAIVSGCILWLARKLRIPRVPATFLTIAASFAYALFTGFATPVQRSLWMVTLYLLGRLIYRERSPINTIGFASLCLLAITPRSLFDSSLQMTLLAVIAIGGIAMPLLQSTVHPYLTATRDLRLLAMDIKLAPPHAQFRVDLRMIAKGLNKTAQGPLDRQITWTVFSWAVRVLLRTVELLVVSCIIELAMTLPMALYFHRITIFALPVNLLILPLLIILMPAALITLFVALIWPAGAAFVAMIAAVPLHFGVGMVHLFGSLTFGDFRLPAPLLWQSFVFCGLLGVAIMLAHCTGWQRRAMWVTMIFAALVSLAPRSIQHPHNALLVEAIDVGQGDSILLIAPDGKTLLVDGGGLGGGSHQIQPDFDMGEEVVSEALWSRGIRHLDAVALTHAHADHIGGIPAVLRNFHPAELWVGNNPPIGAYRELLSQAVALHVRLRSLRAGDSFALGPTQIAVLAPFRGYLPGPEPGNNDSLVLHVSYGATSVMLEGDAEAPIERAMLAEQSLQSTLLKVGHHGSITSTHPEFLSRVSPQWAIISCGLNNRYGHPRVEVLAELQAAGVHTFSTDIGGMACFQLDGNNTFPDLSCDWRKVR